MQSVGYSLQELNLLPDKPGVYKFLSQDNKLIYVGKAKNLKKRVKSYFNKQQKQNRKTQKLVSEIHNYSFTVVDNELDALLLENNLIKENQPKYNILLKDDKTFPYICITKERFPRIISTRKLDKARGEYFGPYSSVVAMNTVLNLIRKLYTIRTCKLILTEQNINKNKFKICLEYHLKNCKGPCEGLQTEEEYLEDIQSCRKILKGKLTEVKDHFKKLMTDASKNLHFEKAQFCKDKLNYIDKFQSKSLVVNPQITNVLVFVYTENEKYAFINYLKINDGAIVNARTFEVKKNIEEDSSKIIKTIAFDIIKTHDIEKQEIISNISFEIGNIRSVIPQRGDKLKLLNLSLKNALEYKKNKLITQKPTHKNFIVLEQLKKDLSLPSLPKHIECFDNSNIQGTNPVASMVHFKNGMPYKKEYRHYNIKTVEGPDDFASMNEVVTRRYSKLKNDNLPLPDLIVIDGGKGQLSMACKALKTLNLYGAIPIIGIAKRLEEIYFPEDQYPLHIDKKSTSLRLLQHIRDEAHRFAITFHRKKRSANSLKSELEIIPQIGSETLKKLMINFKSVKKIKNTKKEDLEKIIGERKAEIIINYFK